jgi:hypothetical protein
MHQGDGLSMRLLKGYMENPLGAPKNAAQFTRANPFKGWSAIGNSERARNKVSHRVSIQASHHLPTEVSQTEAPIEGVSSLASSELACMDSSITPFLTVTHRLHRHF